MLASSYTLSTTTELGLTEAAERVRAELKRAGYDVVNLEGGINAWARACLPLSTSNERKR